MKSLYKDYDNVQTVTYDIQKEHLPFSESRRTLKTNIPKTVEKSISILHSDSDSNSNSNSDSNSNSVDKNNQLTKTITENQTIAQNPKQKRMTFCQKFCTFKIFQ